MEREKVIELARIGGAEEYTIGDPESPFAFEFEITQLQEFARLVEQETLERAARVAEKRELHDWDFLKNSDPRITIADAIRNLKDNHDKE